MKSLTWEDIPNDNTSTYLRRTRIPGGWLVQATEDVIHDHSAYGRGMVGGWDWRVSLCFVPDPNHEWNLEVNP